MTSTTGNRSKSGCPEKKRMLSSMTPNCREGWQTYLVIKSFQEDGRMIINTVFRDRAECACFYDMRIGTERSLMKNPSPMASGSDPL
jgi:hypothetical protein